MTTRYTQVGEAYRVNGSTIEATANAVILTTATLLVVTAINVADNYVTGGFIALAIAICVSLGTTAAITAIARWMLVRRDVSNTNLQRNNGDRLFKVLATFTVICFGVAAAALALQIFEVNLANEFSAAFFQMKSTATEIANLVTKATHIN